MTLIEQIKRDRERPQVKRLSRDRWEVVADSSPGILNIVGPSFIPTVVTTATDLNGEDYIARQADARRIARVPDYESALLMADELAEAVRHEREMVCQEFDMQLKASVAVDEALAAWNAATKGDQTNDDI